MIKIQTKEHLVYFMQCGMMKLSHYDLKFVINLQNLITTKQSITTNQVNLFYKLVEKYKKQFTKHKLTQEFLSGLQWNTNIVESSKEFTEVFVQLIDSKIHIKCPFNKKFLHEVREVKPNPFKWKKDEKRYESIYSTYALKLATTLLEKHYNKVNYCEQIQYLLNTVHNFSQQNIWQPTLVHRNNLVYIAAINSFVEEATRNIHFAVDIDTVSKLGEYGIYISEELKVDKKLDFASQFFYETDVDELYTILDWLKELNCDCVLFSGLGAFKLKNDLHEKLQNLNIDYLNQSDILFAQNRGYMKPYKHIVSIHFNSVKINPSLIYKHELKKVIKVKNSYPITIK